MKRLAVHVEMSDGTVLDGMTRMSDYTGFEMEAKRKGWGPLSENPNLWEAWVSWKALVRDRLLSMPFDVFIEQADVIDAHTPKADENGSAAAATADGEVQPAGKEPTSV